MARRKKKLTLEEAAAAEAEAERQAFLDSLPPMPINEAWKPLFDSSEQAGANLANESVSYLATPDGGGWDLANKLKCDVAN